MFAIKPIADSLNPQESWPEGKKFNNEVPLICEILVPENGVFRNGQWLYSACLEPHLNYSFKVFIKEADLYCYSFRNGQLGPSSTSGELSLRTSRMISHPDGVQSGEYWQEKGIDFTFIKFATQSVQDDATFQLEYDRRYSAVICMSVADGTSNFPEQQMESASFIVVKAWKHPNAEKFAPKNAANLLQSQTQRKRSPKSCKEPDAKRSKTSRKRPETPSIHTDDATSSLANRSPHFEPDGELPDQGTPVVRDSSEDSGFCQPKLRSEEEEEERRENKIDGDDDLEHVHFHSPPKPSSKEIERNPDFFEKEFRSMIEEVMMRCKAADIFCFFFQNNMASRIKKDSNKLLNKILEKLEHKKYKDVAEVIKDFYEGFFDVLSTRTRTKKSKLKKLFKVHDVFVEGLDKIFKEYGYCCAQGYGVQTKTYYCEVDGQKITGDHVMLYVKEVKEGSIVVNEEYAYCPTHEEKHKELMIDNVAIPEEEFKRLDLTRTYFDPLETCKHCGRQWHTACAMEYSEKFCTDFVCPTCRHGGFGIDVKIGPFARQLPENALSKHIERHIREVLKEQKKSASSVFIRVLSSEKMEYEIDEIVQKAYNCSSKTIGYWSRVIFAFQVVDAQEVAIFGLRVQEFGEDAPEAMRQLVNISYLDSVRVVDSKEHRIKIFQEIVLSYMMYAAQNGFKKLHIWSRPPSFGEDYIFFSHPITQLYPDQRSLDNWYCTIFEGAKTKKIVESYEKLKEVDSVTKIPLCEDGFIMSMMQEDKYADIEEVLENVNLKLKVNTLYIITLTNPEHLVLDTDLPVRSELFARQPTFLLKARKEKWYFSSLQEAKYSTFCFIREMSQNDREKKSNQLENTD